MLIKCFSAGMFHTNCYVLALGPGSDAIIVDPGQSAAKQAREMLDAYDLKPVAVLLTHGHIDHIWSAREICDAYSIPAYIHPDDRELLTKPGKGIGSMFGALSFLTAGTVFREPEKVLELADGDELDLAGLRLTVDLAPGHTPGSVLFGGEFEGLAESVPIARADGTSRVVLAGDVLFAGSIGRTDLPGGSMPRLLRSIREKLLTLPDDTIVLPGHGLATTIGRERRTNEWIRELRA
ncbi:MAG: MBL fold metallo-hydrolase [Segniliparus sp.]|uniref:MBL fold metallo-hydrolase n=1 Tax=Segniliparus sp. TaxID=2804064 RepID=UPI003F2B48F5